MFDNLAQILCTSVQKLVNAMGGPVMLFEAGEATPWDVMGFLEGEPASIANLTAAALRMSLRSADPRVAVLASETRHAAREVLSYIDAETEDVETEADSPFDVLARAVETGINS